MNVHLRTKTRGADVPGRFGSMLRLLGFHGAFRRPWSHTLGETILVVVSLGSGAPVPISWCWSGSREVERSREVWRRFSDKSCRKATACGV